MARAHHPPRSAEADGACLAASAEADGQSRCPFCQGSADGRRAELLDWFAALLDGAGGSAPALTTSVLHAAPGSDALSQNHEHEGAPVARAAAPAPTPRWGTVLEAAAQLDVSRATLDRMRKQQRKEGWVLPGDPVQIGVGKQRNRERWDLDRVGEWAKALREHRRALQGPAKQRSRRPAKPTRKVRPPTRGQEARGARPKSLYARAKAQVAGLDSDG